MPLTAVGAQDFAVTNNTGVAVRLTGLTAGTDTSLLAPATTCAANQVLQPGGSCTVSLGGVCAVASGFAVSGNVLNDVNGLADGAVNGVGTDAGGLYVNLVDAATSLVVQSVAVNADGSYSLANVPNGSYNLVLSTTQGATGAAAPAASLPTGWVHTGEGQGTGNAGDGSANGTVSGVTVNNAAVTAVDFGIEQPPTASGGRFNNGIVFPYDDHTKSLLPAWFDASDPAPGAVVSYQLTSFPTFSFTNGAIGMFDAPWVRINGTVYSPLGGPVFPHANSLPWPAAGVTVPSLTSVDVGFYFELSAMPVPSDVEIAMPYTVRDAAGHSASATVVSVSGIRIQ